MLVLAGQAILRMLDPNHFYAHPIVNLFLLGMAVEGAWRWFGGTERRRTLIKRGRWALLALAIVALVLMVLRDVLDLRPRWRHFGVTAVIVDAAACLLERYAGMALRSRLLQRVGDASYILYIIHPFIILPLQGRVYAGQQDMPLIRKYALFAVVAVVCCWASICLEERVDRPLRAAIHRRTARQRRVRTSP